jgi:DNA helicase-2/ATP-dependent DNA helicase PcrA
MKSKSAPHPLPAEPQDGINASEAEILQGLNDAQKEAVLHGEGPLLIVAGAGTGKTTVLTRRIAHLIESKQAKPEEILALTFTDKAAAEMDARVDELLKKSYFFNNVRISTFHAFGDTIVRDHAFEIGRSTDLQVLTSPETVVLLRQHLFDLKLNYYRPLSDPTRFVEDLIKVFSRAKDEDISPESYLEEAKSRLARASTDEEKEKAGKDLEVAEAYRAYEEIKLRNGFIDFGDQVVLALKIFRERPAILAKFQANFKYILVDEFQDTNYSQFELLKLLAGDRRNITVVGDDDQSIYKFRGACLSNILGFTAAYPEARQVVLQENYRSTQSVLDAAYKLIQHNNPQRLEVRNRISKSLRSTRPEPGVSVAHQSFETREAEVEWIADRIKAGIAEGRSPQDFAVLVRTNAAAKPFIKSLEYHKIPWRFSGNAGLYEHDEIRTAMAFLRILDQPTDSASLFFLVSTFEPYGLDAEDLARLSEQAGKTRRPLEAIFQMQSSDELPEGIERVPLSPGTKEKIARILADFRRYRSLASKEPTGRLLYRFLEDSGVLKRMAESSDALEKVHNLGRFFEIVKKFGEVSRYDRVHYFVEYVDALRSAGEDPASAEASFDEGAVNILTVHKAKGLEFPVVFLVGLEKGHFPVNDRGGGIDLPDALIKDLLPEGDVHLQEERRLFYVGMTRAKDELFLTSAKDMGGKKIWKTSPFVLEALEKEEADAKFVRNNPLATIQSFAPSETRVGSAEGKVKESGPVSISVVTVEEYQFCPLKYKYSKVYRIPVLTHHGAVFGTAVHEALREYHLMRREGREAGVEVLLEAFKRSWKSEGFVSREHEDQRFQEGERVLRAYYEKEEASPDVPTLVEEGFKIVIDGSTVRGRFDRVDAGPGKSRVIDYKTGDVKNQKDADQKAKKSSQLALYSAAFRDRYGKLPDEAVLHFIKDGLIGSVVPTDKLVESALEEAREVIRGVSEQKFDPTPGHHCNWCAYEKICPAAENRP